MMENLTRRGDPCGRPISVRRRSSLRLKTHDYSSQGAYFITVCSKKRRPIFATGQIREAVVSEMKDLGKRFGVFLDRGVVSVDHVHMLLRFEGKREFTISQVLNAFKSLCYHKVRDISGDRRPFWQRGFYDHVIRNECDWKEKAEYIENHPFKEGGDKPHPYARDPDV